MSSSSSSLAFGGSLQPKKKAELQEIAQALKIDDTGTREELQTRIKKHLDENTRELEDDPAFAGLFASRRRGRGGSAQPQTQPPLKAPVARGLGGIKEMREESPGVDDMRDVSMMIPRAPISPGVGARPRTPESAGYSSLPPLPPSPAKSIIADAMAQPEVQAVVEMERNVIRGGFQVLAQTRALLSNGRNIVIITTIFDFVSILLTIHYDEPFPVRPITQDFKPAATAMLLATLYWAIPSLFVPSILGFLISFAPQTSPRSQSSESQSPLSTMKFDPLTSSIVRVAANLVFPIRFMALSGLGGVQTAEIETINMDVLGSNWRVFTGSLALAFTLAEAIGQAGGGGNVIKRPQGRRLLSLGSERMASPASAESPSLSRS
ncbi:hypothetical protein BD410DRAFT_138012 [Rickenella mellea]|uniref:SAP domain-containing protein n=1 Tax=Rickenella mellea TaxID=50990 RepID=A0A4Y7PKL9_9AGAM|nr:hypothetical protein BD410DRAFT_138012 [Rickenella mellea]